MAEEQPDLRWMIVAAEPMTDIDTTASDMLVDLDEWLNARSCHWRSPRSRTRCGRRSSATS